MHVKGLLYVYFFFYFVSLILLYFHYLSFFVSPRMVNLLYCPFYSFLLCSLSHDLFSSLFSSISSSSTLSSLFLSSLCDLICHFIHILSNSLLHHQGSSMYMTLSSRWSTRWPSWRTTFPRAPESPSSATPSAATSSSVSSTTSRTRTSPSPGVSFSSPPLRG